MQETVLQLISISTKRKEIKKTDSLEKDLGLDSMDLVELMIKIEDKLNIEISEEDFNSIKTVGELESYLAKFND